MLTNSYIIEPKKMSPVERDLLAKKVFSEAHSHIFDGVDFEGFYHTVFSPESIRTKIILCEKNGKIFAYASFQLYRVKLKNKKTIYIIMSEIGKKKGSASVLTNFILKETVKQKILKFTKKIFIIDTLISPNIYIKSCRIVPTIYPKHNAKTPEKLMNLLLEIAKYFNWTIDIKNNAMVRHLQWRVKERFLIKNTENDLKNIPLNYYTKIVPDCHVGKGLVIVIPVTLHNIFFSIKNS